MTTRTGSCLCGQVKYTITAEPATARVCWCSDCLRLAGNGTVNAIFPSNAIAITGETGAYVKKADSGNTITRRFCPKCGSPLFADSSGRVGMTVVRVGTLDDPSSVQPSANIWAASAPSWACLDDSLARFDGQPPAPQAAQK